MSMVTLYTIIQFLYLRKVEFCNVSLLEEIKVFLTARDNQSVILKMQVRHVI